MYIFWEQTGSLHAYDNASYEGLFDSLAVFKSQWISVGSGEAGGRSSRIRISSLGSMGHSEYDAVLETVVCSLEMASDAILRRSGYVCDEV
jgi:hypothetical protein